MSDLKNILDRLVQENLHGPVDHRNQDPVKSHALRQATRPSIEHHTYRNGHQDPSDDDDEDLDVRDPRWRQLFQEFFLSDHSDDRNDDLLFFVQRPEVENGGLGTDPVFVKRKVKGTKRILTAEQEAVVLWKDTFFLNVIVQLQCKLTVAICSRVAETNPLTGVTKTSMTCTRKHVAKRVYALPTKSRMDVKEESVECSWPLIYYVIDDYEDSFEQLMVRDNEYLCVELAVTIPSTSTSTGPGSIISSAHRYQDNSPPWGLTSPTGDGPQLGRPFPSSSRTGKITLFQGAAGFQSLLGIYQQKSASKVGKRFKLGPHTVPTEFVMMRGPGGKGHAQVAITASNMRDESSLDEPVRHQDLTTTTASSPPTRPTSYQYPPPSLSSTASPPVSFAGSTFSSREKNLPPIPSATSAHNGNGNGHGYHNHNYQEKSTSPPSSSPPAKSFSTGSFFQSLRRISMATLAQAAGHHTSGGGGGGGTNATSPGEDQNPQASRSSQSVSSQGQPSDGGAPGSPSGSIQDGVGSRQEIEDLVRRPQGLRCCMTFVNVPWTSIATMLMDQAYAINSAQAK
ncbi:hypothetical protein MVEG_12258 [Podila verticillata NRRL 6337]|uniref:Uncharacterized protein n=1 Tax=Podila verticillata NRRL 6337 TaxID=1069443 RepID=A0A086TIZ7_9FUNG|nr:hypothetical protein MVEG_12258 [Podila verticillata NRRL 6337]